MEAKLKLPLCGSFICAMDTHNIINVKQCRCRSTKFHVFNGFQMFLIFVPDGKEFTMIDGVHTLTPALDKAVSAFIEDVDQRGLSEKILLVITGEFGRTPRINKNGGRDHWGNLCTLAFVGGGLRMGQVVGRSDRTAGAPASSPISSDQVRATILHSLLDRSRVRVLTGIPGDVQDAVTVGQPIAELI